MNNKGSFLEMAFEMHSMNYMLLSFFESFDAVTSCRVNSLRKIPHKDETEAEHSGNHWGDLWLWYPQTKQILSEP